MLRPLIDGGLRFPAVGEGKGKARRFLQRQGDGGREGEDTRRVSWSWSLGLQWGEHSRTKRLEDERQPLSLEGSRERQREGWWQRGAAVAQQREESRGRGQCSVQAVEVDRRSLTGRPGRAGGETHRERCLTAA